MHAYKLLQGMDFSKGDVTKQALPYHTGVDENVIMSNLCITKMVDIKWRGVGGGRTLCRYQSMPTKFPLVSNVVVIAGQLDDGTMVIDVVLNAKRLKRLKEELTKLIKAAELK